MSKLIFYDNWRFFFLHYFCLCSDERERGRGRGRESLRETEREGGRGRERQRGREQRARSLSVSRFECVPLCSHAYTDDIQDDEWEKDEWQESSARGCEEQERASFVVEVAAAEGRKRRAPGRCEGCAEGDRGGYGRSRAAGCGCTDTRD